MRIITLIDDSTVIERILRNLKVWNPGPTPVQPAGRATGLGAVAQTLRSVRRNLGLFRHPPSIEKLFRERLGIRS
jgi:hypothetical protein